MAADNLPDGPYVVELTGIAREQIRDIARRAVYSADHHGILAAFRRILARLAADPLAVGDPIYRIRPLRMDILHFVDQPLYVQYGVPDGRKVAIVRRFVQMTGTAR